MRCFEGRLNPRPKPAVLAAGVTVAVGNRRLLEEAGVPVTAAAAEFVRGREGSGHTCIFVAAAGR